MVHVLICTDQLGHCGQDVCILAVSTDKFELEDIIEEKKEHECYRYCKFRICSGVEFIDRSAAGKSTATEPDDGE